MNLEGLEGLTHTELQQLPRTVRETAAKEVLARLYQLRMEEQLFFYQASSKQARKIHLSTAKELVATGGNRSGKSDTSLAEMAIQMTGIVPKSLEKDYPRVKLRPPIRVRLVCASLTNTWDAVIKPKLQYWQWNGAGDPGGDRGHWGWIPKRFLINGKWTDSWSEKQRTLRLTNGSTMQVNSYDQSVEDFSGSSLHLILHDEGPPSSIYRENKMRTIDVSGRLMIAFTPPDDTSSSWDAAWIYDDLYTKGLAGPDKDPQIDAITLFTEENRILSMDEVQMVAKGLTPEQKEVRLRGAFMHLGGRIYKHFSDRQRYWCFTCADLVLANDNLCAGCFNKVIQLCHVVEPFELGHSWPLWFAIDPHPRKPHAMAWYVITPSDEMFQVAELEVDAEPSVVRAKVQELEKKMHLDNIVRRYMDPNMGKSPSGSGGRRNRTVEDDFNDVGLRCDMADDNRDTARSLIRGRLIPDPRTERPMLSIWNTCVKTIYQMNRYSWDEWARGRTDTKDPKATPQDKFSDFPTLLGYVCNSMPSYRGVYAPPVNRLAKFTKRVY